MIELKINNNPVKVESGTTILQAANQLGIEIPTMCYLEGYSNHPSCMVCVVKDNKTGELKPSCAMPAQEGMDIITNDDEVREARKESLELLLSDHVGDCEAPCRISCPAYMDIPVMNRHIATGDFDMALKVVKNDIALPLVLGYICSAPCEGACRRKSADNAVSICILKRFVADFDLKNNPYFPEKKKSIKKKVAVIGSGPAGLACAFYLLKEGHQCVVIDENEKAGGSLLAVPESEMPQTALEEEVSYLTKFGASFHLKTVINKDSFKEIQKEYDAIVLATGDLEKSNIVELELEKDKKGLYTEDGTYATKIKGVFACGSVVRHHKMAIRALAQGKEAAYSVSSFLNGNNPIAQTKTFNSRFNKLQESEVQEYLKEATSTDRIEPKEGQLQGFSKEEAIEEAKRCMRCDCRKPNTCKLRIYANEYDANQKKYSFGERKVIQKYFQHDKVIYEPEKCIKCGLCIDIASNEKELTGLTYIGRGFRVKVKIPFNRTLGEALTKTAQKCTEACPTGALSFLNGEK